MPLLLSVFSRKITYIYEVKVNNFWSHYIFDPPGSDQFDMFWRYLIKFTIVKEKYLDNILSISVCFCCL